MSFLVKIVLIISIVILLFSTYLHSISAITQDLGRHILMGDIIFHTHQVPKTNLLSYTYPNFPFINHHWFSEVIFYLTYTLSGFTGTLLLTTLCYSTSMLLLVWFTLKKRMNILAIAIVSFLSLGVLFERTDVRPEAFSMLFLSIFLVILFQNREKATKWLYTLIPLELLWTNTHVYFPIGILVSGLFFIDSICHSWLDQESRSRIKSGMTKKQWNNETMKQFLPLFFVLIGCILVTLLNPNGINGALYPLHVFDNYGYSIEENQNIFFLWEYFQKQTIVFFWASVFSLFSLFLIRIKYTRFIDWLLAICFSILAMQAIRNFPLFVLTTFIPFTTQLSPFFEKIKPRTQTIFSILLISLFLWQWVSVITVKPISIATPTGASKAADFVIQHHISGPFFNNFDIGSYFLFRFYGKSLPAGRQVFVDGRPEAYPASFFQNTYIPMQQNPKLFNQITNKYHINAIFFSHTDQTPWGIQFLQNIVKNPSWKIVYLDDTVIILVKNTPQNQTVSPLILSSFTPPSSSVQGLYQLLVFFQKIQDSQNLIKTAQEILRKDPTNCIALSLLAQSPNGLLYQARYLTSCH